MIENEAGAKHWISTLPEADALAMERLERLATLLRDENARQNLVSAASLDHIWQRHFADSAQLLRFAIGSNSTWLDLGSGAGFPGLVLSILRPTIKLTMIESRAKRSEWLKRCVELLGLSSTSVIHGEIGKIEAVSSAVISARALAPLDRILELAERFSTAHTLWLLPKGRSAQIELASLTGWRHRFHVEHSLTDGEAGIIVGYLDGQQKGLKPT